METVEIKYKDGTVLGSYQIVDESNGLLFVRNENGIRCLESAKFVVEKLGKLIKVDDQGATSLDAAGLPVDIQRAVSTAKDLDAATVNALASKVSNTVLTGLRRENFDEEKALEIAARVLKSTKEILSSSK